MMVTEGVRDLYVASWGPPSRSARFTAPGGLEAHICKWDKDAIGEGVALYATIGASAHPMPGMDPKHRVEYFLGLNPPRDQVASPFAALALYSAREAVSVGSGDSVPADKPLWPGTKMRRFLIVHPVEYILAPLELPDNVHVNFLQAIPIYDSELAYKSERGVQGLLDLWSESKVRFWDPDRSPVPASV